MSRTARIAAVGDVMLGEYAALGFGARTRSLRMGGDWLVERVGPLLSQFDCAVGNLEAPLSERGRRFWIYDSVIFRGHPGATTELRRAGFRALSLANNHMLQHGREAFSDTVRAIEGEGIAAVGVRAPNGGSRLARLEVGGRSLGLLGYSLWPSEVNEEHNDCFPMLVGRENVILEDIRRHAGEVDDLLVSIHWGYEFVHVPSEAEIALGRAMIEAGARVVLGHHPHVLQGIEEYGGGLIAYSLGNFVFDMDMPDCLESVVLEVGLADDGVDWRLHPVVLDEDFRPRPATEREAAAILERMAEWSRAISDPATAGQRGVDACRAASAEGKLAAQAIQNRFFVRNLHRYPKRFLLLKLYRKLKNKLLGRYSTRQYQQDVTHIHR